MTDKQKALTLLSNAKSHKKRYTSVLLTAASLNTATIKVSEWLS